MEALAKTVYLISAGIWMGAIVFHASVVAPGVFSVLSGRDASDLLRKLFPRFFILGLICGAAMLLALAALWLGAGLDRTGLLLAISTITMVLMQITSLCLVPKINAARDAGERGASLFARLHRISVLLTVGVLLLGLFSLSIAGSQSLTGQGA